MCRQQGQRDGGLEHRGCAYGAGVQRRLEGPLVLDDGTHSALRLGTKGLYAPLVGQAERAMLADQGHLKAGRSCPWAAWKDRFSGLKWRSRNLRPSASLPHMHSVDQWKILEGRHI